VPGQGRTRGPALPVGDGAPAPIPGGGSEVQAFVKERIGSVKAPKQVEVWADLPRSKIGKVLKPDIRAQLLGS
jgi:acyl-coenzyme A synthetase/AMP-(fatty) acid ligase